MLATILIFIRRSHTYRSEFRGSAGEAPSHTRSVRNAIFTRVDAGIMFGRAIARRHNTTWFYSNRGWAEMADRFLFKSEHLEYISYKSGWASERLDEEGDLRIPKSPVSIYRQYLVNTIRKTKANTNDATFMHLKECQLSLFPLITPLFSRSLMWISHLEITVFMSCLTCVR